MDGWMALWREECGVGEGSYGWLGLRMGLPTAHLNQHLLQLPNTKLVHVNQCYIPGIETAYTAGHSFGQLAHVPLCQWEESLRNPAWLPHQHSPTSPCMVVEADWSTGRTLKGQSRPS